MITREKIAEEVKAVIENSSAYINGMTIYDNLREDLWMDDDAIGFMGSELEQKYNIVLFPDQTSLWMTVRDVINSVGDALLESGEIIINKNDMEEI